MEATSKSVTKLKRSLMQDVKTCDGNRSCFIVLMQPGHFLRLSFPGLVSGAGQGLFATFCNSVPGREPHTESLFFGHLGFDHDMSIHEHYFFKNNSEIQ